MEVSNKDNCKSFSGGVDKNNSVYNGCSDCDLEFLTGSSGVDNGTAPWVYWTSELYSFGRLYREWAYYPDFLPLFIYSDHGVHKVPGFMPHELNNGAKVHFTFNEKRVLKNSNTLDKKVILVPHPWVTYRRRKNISQTKDAKGTLVFFSHSCEGVELSGHDSDEYFKILKQLPNKYKPLVLCMHIHDIKKRYHKKLRKHGIPIITAGNTSSIQFVDCFYNMVKEFKYATSNVGGSQLYYCVEMGVPYFLLGNKIKAENYSHPELPLGDITLLDPMQAELVGIERELFRQQNDSVNLKQSAFVGDMLGLNSDLTRLEASWILWCEFFRNWMRWQIMLRPTVVWILRKIGLLKLIKKYRN